MRTFVIGTAGHVDHGKTALVRALTNVETDRLPEEKRRGISIELGFAPWRVEDDLTATVIDVPGHRRLVHTMIAGASGIELVLLVVAANEGVMPQTREHARVCEALGIREAVVVLTKSDLVDEETLALAEAEARELLLGRFNVSVVSCSASRGTGLGDVRAEVARRLRALPAWAGSGAARLWVDRVFSIRGAGTVVTGTLASGKVRCGDELVVFGAGGVSRVVARELHVHDRVVDEALSPTRLAVNLPVAVQDVHKGDLLGSDDGAGLTTRVDAELRGGRLRRGADVSIHLGSAHVPARVTRVETLDEHAQLARFALGEPRPLRGGDRFVVRHGGAQDGSVACGGVVLDALPPSRSRPVRRRELAHAVRAGDAPAALALLLEEVSPRPMALARGRLPIEAAIGRASSAAVAKGELAKVGTGVLARAALTALADQARALVAAHAVRAPLDRGLPVATLQQKLALRAGPDAAAAAILAARARRSEGDRDLIAIEGDVAILAFKARAADPALNAAVERARAELVAARAHGVSLVKVAEATGGPSDRARAILAALERQGAAVKAGDLWFSREIVDEMWQHVTVHLSRSPRLTVLEFKALGDLPRKQAVLLLEHFDQAGLTRRTGDARVLFSSKR